MAAALLPHQEHTMCPSFHSHRPAVTPAGASQGADEVEPVVKSCALQGGGLGKGSPPQHRQEAALRSGCDTSMMGSA